MYQPYKIKVTTEDLKSVKYLTCNDYKIFQSILIKFKHVKSIKNLKHVKRNVYLSIITEMQALLIFDLSLRHLIDGLK